jgi:hypothetical protein
MWADPPGLGREKNRDTGYIERAIRDIRSLIQLVERNLWSGIVPRAILSVRAT